MDRGSMTTGPDALFPARFADCMKAVARPWLYELPSESATTVSAFCSAAQISAAAACAASLWAKRAKVRVPFGKYLSGSPSAQPATVSPGQVATGANCNRLALLVTGSAISVAPEVYGPM